MFWLPTTKHKTSQVHMHTICKHAVSYNPGSPAWCMLPFLPMQYQISHIADSLWGCNSFNEARPVRLRYGLFTGFKELQPVLLPEWLSFHLPDEWQIVWTGFSPVYMSYASWRTGRNTAGEGEKEEEYGNAEGTDAPYRR